MVGIHQFFLDGFCAETCFPVFFLGVQSEVTAKDIVPAEKSGRFVTSSRNLADDLSSLRCAHAEHAPWEGHWTNYPPQLCRIRLQSIFPYVVNFMFQYAMCCAQSASTPTEACERLSVSSFGRVDGRDRLP